MAVHSAQRTLVNSEAVGFAVCRVTWLKLVCLTFLSFHLQATFLFSLIKYTPLTYNKKYVYPWWGDTVGWLLALSSMICIPLWIAYKLSTIKGSLREVRLGFSRMGAWVQRGPGRLASTHILMERPGGTDTLCYKRINGGLTLIRWGSLCFRKELVALMNFE